MDRSPTTLPRAEVVQISASWDRRVLAELRLRLDWAWYSLIRENSSALIFHSATSALWGFLYGERRMVVEPGGGGGGMTGCAGTTTVAGGGAS
jgi:hypothetical protein